MRTIHRVTHTIAAAVPLAVLLGMAPARAQPKVYYHAGSWHAFTDKDTQGTGVCGIGTENPSDGRSLTLTYTIGGSDLTMTAEKPSWNIPDGTMLQANTQIDGGEPWQAQAAGHGTTVEWLISAASIRDFDTQFRNGSTLTITFPSGNEPTWTLRLNGSTMASATLWRCVQDLSDRAHVSQPASAPTAGSGASTQPYGQAPTQPYAPPDQSSGQGAAQSAPSAQGQAPAGSGTPANGTPAPAAPPAAGTTPAPAPKP